MSMKFLFCSAVLFLGGTLLTFLGALGADFAAVLGILLMVMGGFPILLVWGKELFRALPAEPDHTETEDK